MAGLLACTAAAGALTKLYVDQRTDHNEGASFGNAGPYERITANAFSGDSTTPVHIDVLKPRDPKSGNGTLLYIIGRGPDEKALLEAGFTILRVQADNATAVRDVVEYFRYGAQGILLLSDQRRFVKRAIAFASGADAKKLATLGQPQSAKPIFDVLWVHDSDLKIDAVPGGAQVHVTKGKPLEALAIQLNTQLTTGK